MKKKHIHANEAGRWLAIVIGAALLAIQPAGAATIIEIVNPGFEIPELPNEINASFDGEHGGHGSVPGWSSNEASFGGAIHVDQWFPGRTGNNVMYLHGSANQNFYTAGFDLGTELQSHKTYVLTFDVLRWYGWDGVTSITQDNYVTFRAGIYTGDDYESRVALAEISGDFYLLDGDDNPLAVATVVLDFTTGMVAEGTKFWIGGDAFGNNLDGHRTHFDNFQLMIIPEPSSVALMLLGAAFVAHRCRKIRRSHS